MRIGFKTNAAFIAVALAVGGCTKGLPRDVTSLPVEKKVPVPYPATPAGDALRAFCAADQPTWEQFYKVTENLKGPERSQRLAELLPALMTIIRQEDGLHATFAAIILIEDSKAFLAAAPECRRIVPALVRGLDGPNPRETPDPRQAVTLTAMSSSMLLYLVGPDASYEYYQSVGTRFNAPVNGEFEGESPEGWTLFGLYRLLVGYGERGLPALSRGLKHPSAIVRYCALTGISNIIEVPRGDLVSEMYGWDDAWARVRAAQPRARAIARSAVAAALNDSDSLVRSAGERLKSALEKAVSP